MSAFSSRSPVMAIVLFVSLAINLFLGGFLIAREIYGPGHHARTRMGPVYFLHGRPTESDSALGKFHAGLRERRDDLRDGYVAFRKAREDVKQAMSADNFDPEALQRGLDGMREATLTLQKISQDVLMSISSTLTAEERRDLLKALNLRFSGAAAGLHTRKRGASREFAPEPFERRLDGDEERMIPLPPPPLPQGE
jgi:uncharacterized membrane protein